MQSLWKYLTEPCEPEPEPKRGFWDYVAAIFVAAIILHWMQLAIEADPVRCNALIDKPDSLFARVLTCQKTYRYQPDPFTG